jgi:hypothetical protein
LDAREQYGNYRGPLDWEVCGRTTTKSAQKNSGWPPLRLLPLFTYKSFLQTPSALAAETSLKRPFAIMAPQQPIVIHRDNPCRKRLQIIFRRASR